MVTFFRVLGWLEGTSLLLLMFVAMPFKYFYHDPSLVRSLGPLHGILFLIYVIAAIRLSLDLMWSKKTLIVCLILSSIPFGTFIFEKKYL
jgi:integral membrane protein